MTPTDRPRALPSARRLLIVGCGDVGLRVARPAARPLAAARPDLDAGPARGPARRRHRAAGRRPRPAGNAGPAGRPGRCGAAPGAAGRRAAPRTGAPPALLAGAGPLAAPSPPGLRLDQRRLRRLRRRARRRDPAAGARPPTAPAAASMPRRGCAPSAARAGVAVTVLRIPGIYALDRAGGDPRERLRRGTPVLAAADDVYTNHIHADDLARACVAALYRGRPQRVVNASDDSELKHGRLLRPRRRPARPGRGRRACRAPKRPRALSPLQMSFLGESRRLVNRRLKEELGLVLRHATGHAGLARFHRLRAGRSRPNNGPTTRKDRRSPCVPRCAGSLRTRAILAARPGGDVPRPSSQAQPSRSRAPRPPAPGRPSRSAWSRLSIPAGRSTCSTGSSPRSSASASASRCSSMRCRARTRSSVPMSSPRPRPTATPS